MTAIETQRTLVKSAPELWAEISDDGALARHLEPFAPLRITRAEPESVVEWEGDRGRGAVRLEAAGFGTRVVLSAEPSRRSQTGFLARFLRRPPAEEGLTSGATLHALTGALDSLGTAHHRPFSR